MPSKLSEVSRWMARRMGWKGSQERSDSAMKETSVGLSSAEGIKEIRGSNWALILETRM